MRYLLSGDKPASKMTTPSEQYREFTVPRGVHILGLGNDGLFIAHSLRGAPNPPPVTLIANKPSLVGEWDHVGREITLRTRDVDEARNGFDMELALPRNKMLEQEGKIFDDRYEYWGSVPNTPAYPIHNLILTVKATGAVTALEAVKNRLTRDTTICFLQHGMGVIDEVNKKVFPDRHTRPNYMLGILSHTIFVDTPFKIHHWGFGTIALGLIPRLEPESTSVYRPLSASSGSEKHWATSSRYLLRTLTRSPALAAVAFPPHDLHLLQLEKLAVNCIINPLSVVLDARNGSLLWNFALTRVVRLLVAEISLVIRSLPELHNIPNVAQRFSSERLETLAFGVAAQKSRSISTMLSDVRAGKETEIEYLNGYVCRRGEEIGIKCVMNYLLMQMVIGKQQMVLRELIAHTPSV